MAESRYMELDINVVELDSENPRIKVFLDNFKNPTAADIALALNGASNDGPTSINSLKESIRVNGGIINPIIVNYKSAENKYVAIEGNTRLQIYKEFASAEPDSNKWKRIRSVVYTDLKDDDIHSIRLQSHLVGPRDWEPYSKAKYLDYLWTKEKLPINTIISFCGGKKSEIFKLVYAYRDMQEYYVKKIDESDGEYEFDARDFSKYSELQNKGIIDALLHNGFNKEDFTNWVLERHIDTAQNVRQLPLILKDKAAREEFLKTNITKAMTKLNIQTAASNIDLTTIDYLDLCKALRIKLDSIQYKDVVKIWSEEGQEVRSALLGVVDSIDFVLRQGNDEGEE